MIWGNYRGIQRALSRKPEYQHLHLSLTFKIVFLILLKILLYQEYKYIYSIYSFL